MGSSRFAMRAWAGCVGLVLATLVCMSQADPANLVTELDDGTVALIELQAAKLKSAEEVKALVDKHGTPETPAQSGTNSTNQAASSNVAAMGAKVIAEMTKKMAAMEKK